jgi:quercetin dioxygenase-like cupin family protein
MAKAKAKAKSSKTKKPAKQVFNVSHAATSKFKEGLRSYAKYRDLGMSKATGGLLQAHVIKMVPPCKPEIVSRRHFHDVEVQMIYVLKGWIRSEFEGKEHTFRQGSAWLQPPRIRHTVLDYSEDCEMLEIILPAEFETVEL